MKDYRYTLERTVNPLVERSLLWVMLNPSTADATQDDPTIRRVMRFTADHGYGSLLVLNLWPLRATDPKVMRRALVDGTIDAEAVSRNNDLLGRHFFERDEFVAAWGANAWAEDRAEDVLALARGYDCQAMALEVTDKGFPRHPLMLPASARLRPYA